MSRTKNFAWCRLPTLRRRGFSLMEVLVSIFVILFGLLGVAALWPVGRFDMAEANKAERSAASGRAALHEMRVRAYSNPRLWCKPDGSLVVPIDPAATLYGKLNNTESFAIDPLFIAQVNRDSSVPLAHIQRFPYNHPAPGTALPVTMARVTVIPSGAPMMPPPTAPTLGLNGYQQYAYFDRIFTWRDDLTFARSQEEQGRPTAMFDAGRLANDGAYTWMATVTPARGPEDVVDSGTPYFEVAKKQSYHVSVVVFRDRNFLPPGATLAPGEPPGERAVTATCSGGPEYVLTASAALGAPALSVHENEWLLLCGQETVPFQSGSGSYTRNVFRWYRIVGVGEPEPTNPLRRRVTLEGPDWNPAWRVELDGNASTVEVQAVLFTGAIGVYSQTIELER